jgi:hypothetical protein
MLSILLHGCWQQVVLPAIFSISTPRPIDKTAVKEPLSPDGDNFPCHGVPVTTAGDMKMSCYFAE